MEMTFFNWEGRPAIIFRDGAWFRPFGSSAWQPADAAEIIESGSVLSPEAFGAIFPDAGLPSTLFRQEPELSPAVPATAESTASTPTTSLTRRVLGVVGGVFVAAAIFWFVPDIIQLFGGRFGDRSAITPLAMFAVVTLAGVMVASKIGWGRWPEDDTWPIERSWILLGIATVVLFLSVPYSG